jgi:hypothetical protein
MENFDLIRSFLIKNRTEDHVGNENEINNDLKKIDIEVLNFMN